MDSQSKFPIAKRINFSSGNTRNFKSRRSSRGKSYKSHSDSDSWEGWLVSRMFAEDGGRHRRSDTIAVRWGSAPLAWETRLPPPNSNAEGVSLEVCPWRVADSEPTQATVGLCRASFSQRTVVLTHLFLRTQKVEMKNSIFRAQLFQNRRVGGEDLHLLPHLFRFRGGEVEPSFSMADAEAMFYTTEGREGTTQRFLSLGRSFLT